MAADSLTARTMLGRPRLTLPAALALLVLLAVLPVTLASPARAATVGVPVTYQGFQHPATVYKPTQDKPQSKLWYAAGAWWGLLASPADGLQHVFELKADHRWRDTGTVVDTRVGSTGDALWDGANLYVASRHSSSAARVTKMSYVAATRSWVVSSGFPVTVGGGNSESITIDKDSTGVLWVTYTRNSTVFVAHSARGNDRLWTAAFRPNVPDTAVSSDDISTLVSFNGNIGVLWSDQASNAVRFAVHPDGASDATWRVETPLRGVRLADDHLNIKVLPGDPQGRVFAAVKTSLGDSASDPRSGLGIAVLVRARSGTWTVVPAGTVADELTRPILVLDRTNQQLYVVATAPTGGPVVYFKRAPLSNLRFPAGRGTPLLRFTGHAINDATASKQPVTAQTGLVVLATSQKTRTYFHAEMALAG